MGTFGYYLVVLINENPEYDCDMNMYYEQNHCCLYEVIKQFVT